MLQTTFIAKHHKHVDYLLVDQMDRFSHDAGEAMTLVKALQKRYGIQVVSVTEGITFDYDTPGSFFRAGLQLLLAEEDNINRSIKIRGGNYTARAKEGRFLSNLAPFGYRKSVEGKQRGIVVEERDAETVRFIFDAFGAAIKIIMLIIELILLDAQGKEVPRTNWKIAYADSEELSGDDGGEKQ